MPPAKPRVIAHRGAKHCCPENTLSAFDEALAETADGIELDLRLTRDGVPVVFHDHTLRKLGQRRQRLSALTLAQLRQLDFGAWFADEFRGEPLPTLGQVLHRYGSRTELCLEFKTRRDPISNAELVRQTVGLVRDAGTQDSVYLLCFDASLLQIAHRLAPELRTVLNAFGPAEALECAAEMPWLFAIDVDIRWLTPAAGKALKAGGRVLMSYTCNTETHLQAACAAGVDAVITNKPGWARDRLQRISGAN